MLAESLQLENETLTPTNLATWLEKQQADDVKHELGLFLKEWWNESGTVALQTSGSTSEPKIINAPKEYLRASAGMSCQVLELKQGQSVLLALPLRYIAAKMMIIRAIVGGLQLHVQAASSRPLQGCSRRFDFAPLVPFQAAQSNQEELERVQTLLMGGGHIPQDVEHKLSKHHGRVFASYGMTETYSHVALRRVNGAEASSFYTALPQVQISLNDLGCICISAPHLGIKNLVTNDLAEFDTAGRFRIIGRSNCTINSGGIKIQAEELEELIFNQCQITSLALPLPHPELGECLGLLWEGDSTKEGTLQSLLEKLPPHHRPKELLHTQAIPRGATGKLARKTALAYFLKNRH